MSDTVIKVENLSKLYRLGEVGTGSLAHDVNRWWHQVRGKEDPYTQVGQVNDRTKRESTDYVWALKDIDFEVKRGDVLGIIGRNGAGKSTLLKIFSRVTAPTRGEVKVKGRIASLLEVGTGFHPELTGRENIFLNGAILGMSKLEIRGKLDQIVEFSGCAAYLDTPVKRYSSGMQVRLAFAVAAHLEPEILIVDEVLAVGDAAFQKRCVGRMSEVAKLGHTVIFVSHQLNVVRALTQRGVVLESGRLTFQGDASEAIEVYMQDDSISRGAYASPPSDADARITAVQVNTSEGGGTQLFGKPISVQLEVSTPLPLNNAAVSFQVVDRYDQPILYQLILDSEVSILRDAGIYRLQCNIPYLRLYPGRYVINAYLGEAPHVRYIDAVKGVCPFEVAYAGAARDHDWQPGLAAYVESGEWSVTKDLAKAGSAVRAAVV